MSTLSSGFRATGIVLKYTFITASCLLLIVPIVFILVTCPEASCAIADLLAAVCELSSHLIGRPGTQKGSGANLG